MAETDKHDKSFEATPHRIRKAREEGNVLRAREIVSVGSLSMGVGLMAVGTPLLFETLRTMMSRMFLGATASTLNYDTVPSIFLEAGYGVILVLTPFFILLSLTGAGLSFMQSGWNLTAKPLEPKASRISPLKGLKRMLSKKSWFELAKAVVKIAVVGPVAYSVIKGRIDQIVLLHTLHVDEILRVGSGWILILFVQMLAFLAVLAAIDFLFEQWRYKHDLRMSRREVKDEAKEQEGSPELRMRRRQLARQIARRPRLDHAILKADVVVTNPTHYAVALRYDASEGSAPCVVAKGIRKRALRIKELAAEHGVPMVEDRPLAQSLYKLVPEEHEIPEDLYAAVAAILAEIYRKRAA